MDSDEFSKRVIQLKSIRSQANMWRLAITVVLIVLTVVCTGMTYKSYQMLTQPGPTNDEFVSSLSAEMQGSVLPQVQDIGTQAIHHIDFQTQFANLNKRAPQVADASVNQLRMLASDLPAKGQDILDKNFDTILTQREQKLHEMFPKATDAQITSLMATLTQEAHDQAGQLANTLFAPHIKALNGIVGDLAVIQSKEAPYIRGEVPTWQMVFLLGQIAQTDFKSVGPKFDKPLKKKGKSI